MNSKEELVSVLEDALIMWERAPQVANAIEALINEKLAELETRARRLEADMMPYRKIGGRTTRG